MCDLLETASDIDSREVRTVWQVFQQAFKAFGVDEGNLGSAISERVLQFPSRPPGIQRRCDSAAQHTSEERRRPFRKVSHCDRDAITFAQPGLREVMGNRQR